VYVRRYLGANARFGKRLGALLAERDIEAGTTWALVPSDSAPDRRAAFEASLFPPAGPAHKVERGFMVPNFIPSTNPQITSAVGALLNPSEGENFLLCMEDAFGRRSDFKLSPDQWPRQVFFCGEEVYDFALADTPLDEAVRVLGGAEWRPDIGLVAPLPNNREAIHTGDDVSPAELSQMAESAVAVILGAWDDDSLLFWEPAKP
jgi:hypothetical protein